MTRIDKEELKLERLVEPKPFSVDLKNIDNWKNEEVELIAPLPIVSNIYVLSVLATLSKVLSRLWENGCGVKITFLLLTERTKNSPYIRDAIELHIKTIMDKEDIFALTEDVRTAEFKSLINNILISLAKIEDKKDGKKNTMKEMILSWVDYIDIDNYIKKKHIPEKIDNRTQKIEDAKEKIKADYLKDFLFKSSTGSESLFVQLLSMINYFRNSEIKRILCINKDIKPAFDGPNSDYFVLLDYPNPIDEAIIKRTGNMIPTFITPTSKYINDTGNSEVLRQLGATNISNKDLPSNFQYCIDEYHFSGLLNALDSLLFKLDLNIHREDKDIYTDKRNGPLKPMITAIKKGILIDDKKNSEDFKKNYRNPQKEILQSIDNGFLTIQNDTMAELKYLL